MDDGAPGDRLWSSSTRPHLTDEPSPPESPRPPPPRPRSKRRPPSQPLPSVPSNGGNRARRKFANIETILEEIEKTRLILASPPSAQSCDFFREKLTHIGSCLDKIPPDETIEALRSQALASLTKINRDFESWAAPVTAPQPVQYDSGMLMTRRCGSLLTLVAQLTIGISR